MTEKTIKVALYARVSTQEQALEGTSLDHQIEQLESYCRMEGWSVVDKYIDPGYTGKDDERPGLKHLMADVKAGLFNKVIVYKLDRLARKLRLLLELEETFNSHNIALHSIKETIDTSTPIGRTVFQVLGLVGEWERESIIERTRSGRIQRYKEGSWAAGYPPYGYSYNKETKKLVIEQTKARVVRRIYEQYNSGKSLSSIANMLNEEKIKPRRRDGKGWRSTAIRNMLINPVYKGTLIVNRHEHISNIDKVDMSKAVIISVPPLVEDKDWQIAHL
jgi:site-specific DNA recombinase